MRHFLLTMLTALPLGLLAQGNSGLIQQSLPNPDNEPAPVFPVPHSRQLAWNETEFYAFFHYGMNTYTDREWGLGDEDEALFAPTKKPNPKQWMKACKAAGMKGGIAVCKHHDGFCLWPTQTTTHNCTRGGNENARKTNIPRDLANAARKLKMKYGFYVSPWDRNNQYYGMDNYVTDVYLRQCAEVSTNGTDQFDLWLDGANGGDGYYGGRRDTVHVDGFYYDIPNLCDSVHKVCPNCVIWGVGNEARWIGNEAGYGFDTMWAISDIWGDPNGYIGNENGWFWLPSESDAMITENGWFWHKDEKVKSPERLFQMYLETVGRNSTLILNCPPDPAGLLPENTVNALKGMGKLIRSRLGHDLAHKADIEVTETRKAGENRNYEAKNLTDGKKDTYWATNDGTTSATITLTWKKPQTIHFLQMMEYIALGQRVKKFRIEYSEDGQNWKPMATNVEQTTIGYKRIIPLNGSTDKSYDAGYQATKLRVTILDSRACPLLSNLSVF